MIVLRILFVMVVTYGTGWATTIIPTNRSNCMICRNLAGHVQEFVPIVEREIVNLYNGTAILQIVKDSAKLEKFYAISRAIDESLQVSKTLTIKGIKDKLCVICQEMFKSIKAGARLSRGQTENGDLTVFISDNPSIKSEVRSGYIGFTFSEYLTEDVFRPNPFRLFYKNNRGPILVKSTKAKYPREAWEKRIEGGVDINVLVDKDGHVIDCQIWHSTNEIFTEAAIKAVKQWIFKPAIANKKKVEGWYETGILFNIIEYKLEEVEP